MTFLRFLVVMVVCIFGVGMVVADTVDAPPQKQVHQKASAKNGKSAATDSSGPKRDAKSKTDASSNGEKSVEVWDRAKTVAMWVAIAAIALLFLASAQLSIGLGIAFGLVAGCAGYIFDGKFEVFGFIGAALGAVVGMVWFLFKRPRRGGIFVGGHDDGVGTAGHLDEYAINPATGLPMVGGYGGVDVGGNTFGSSHD